MNQLTLVNIQLIHTDNITRVLMAPFDFDPHNDGFWGDTTSSLDWCEDNYEVIECLLQHCYKQFFFIF